MLLNNEVDACLILSGLSRYSRNGINSSAKSDSSGDLQPLLRLRTMLRLRLKTFSPQMLDVSDDRKSPALNRSVLPQGYQGSRCEPTMTSMVIDTVP